MNANYFYESIGAVRDAAPFPWSQRIAQRGVIQVLDANGSEVPLLALTSFAVLATAAIAANKAGQQEKES